jgi:hypothetical protein
MMLMMGIFYKIPVWIFYKQSQTILNMSTDCYMGLKSFHLHQLLLIYLQSEKIWGAPSRNLVVGES